ncbi:WGxxGxxG family protein [Peristeroidobacter agariperforans]|uniref:WGxxGxxG family protein n=1 Tax=Peristeroidobacter agariperforans TaxID=268404 RepID=UPI0018E5142F|nr:WGxxGxxG family protein [Peristeroidobacter agariperforans]
MRNVLVRAAALGVLIAAPLSLPAQQAGDDMNQATDRADREDHGEWGWLGLLGLAGLFGLKRRDHDVNVPHSGRAATR